MLVASCAALTPSLLALCRKREHEEQKFLPEGEVSGSSLGECGTSVRRQDDGIAGQSTCALGLKGKKIP